MPRAAEAAMYSKCGVSPRITTPRQITASNLRDSAAFCAHKGISNAPGTRNKSTASSAADACFKAFCAPSISRETIASFQRLATIAKRKLLASSICLRGCDFSEDNLVQGLPVEYSD